LELHPEFNDMIENVYQEFLEIYELSLKEEKSLTIMSTPKSKLAIMKKKEIFSSPATLSMNWSKMLAAELTLRAEDCKEFWNKQCEEKSKNLWFPTKIDYVDSTNSKKFSTKTIQNSWYSVKQYINPVARKKFVPSYKYSSVENWESEGIRALKLKLKPTKVQEKVLEEWSNTTRYVYNKCLDKVKQDSTLNSGTGYSLLREQYITAKWNNIVKKDEIHNFDSFIHDWELNTPKDIRAGALRDIKKGYKTAWANLRAGNIRSFGLNFRQKKNYAEQSIEVPKSAIRLVKNQSNKLEGCVIYPQYMPSTIKFDKKNLKGLNLSELEHDTRLKKENNQWYLCISYDIEGTSKKMKEKTCALDPGVRKFQVMYSEDQVIMIEPDKEDLLNIGYFSNITRF
jgi:hypothetical protein